MDENLKKKVNYSLTEKSLLLNIVQEFKHVVENKKTDAVTWREKDNAWRKICNIFNSKSIEGVCRSKESLRKLYENLKKNVRKQVAEEKKTLVATGGGPPPIKKQKVDNDLQDRILSIINTKTVYGLSNEFDCDATSASPLPLPPKYQLLSQPPFILCEENRNELSLSDNEHSYAQSTVPLSNNEVEIVTTEEIMEESQRLNIEAIRRGQETLHATEKLDKISQITTHEESQIGLHSKDVNIFNTKKNEVLKVDPSNTWSSRRKPILKDTGGVDLKKEYSSLAQVKQELYIEELKLAKNRDKREEELHQLKKSSLQLGIRKQELEIIALQRKLDDY